MQCSSSTVCPPQDMHYRDLDTDVCVCVHTCLSVCLKVSMATLALADWGKGLSKECEHALVTANRRSGRGRGANINCSLLALGNRVGGL